MGVDKLPENIKTSEILTGSDLAILASLESIPMKNKIDIKDNKNLKEKHILAKELLGQGKILTAWQLLL